MNAPRVFLARLGELFRRRRLDDELDEELRHHLDLLTDDYIRRGHARDDARRLARRDLGGIDRARERVRDQRGFPIMEQLTQDFRHAVRLLLQARGFTTVAVTTLALGIGVNTAIFSLVNAALLRPLPYGAPSRLVSIWEGQIGRSPADESTRGTLIGGDDDPSRMVVAPANFIDYQSRGAGFAAMAGLSRTSATLTNGGTPDLLIGEEVTPNYFDVLGVHPALGRSLVAADAQPGARAVTVISDGLWRARFGGDPGIVGKPISLDDQTREIVGVMPASFDGVSHFGTAETMSFWTAAYYPPDLLANHADHEINVIARLAAGASVATAQTSITAISLDLAQRFPQSNDTVRAFVRPLRDDLVRKVRTSLVLLMTIVGLILLIACVNVANLLLVRGAAQRREVAIRFALGASRWRVSAGMLMQSVVLSALACVVGVALGGWTERVLVSIAPQSMTAVGDVRLDWRVLAFSAALSVLTGVVFGVLPAWQARGAMPADALKATERAVASPWMMRWRNGLMVVEIALSTILLVGAGLMIKSLVTLNRVDLGFRTDHVTAMNVNLPVRRYKTGDDRLAFFDALADRLRAVPGVKNVAYANRFPMRGGWESGIEIDGMNGNYVDAAFQAVSPGYFDTLGLRLIAGRLLTPADRQTVEPVAVVSEAFSTTFLGGATPIGRRFRRGEKAPWITIVGVTADIRRDGKKAGVMPQVYLSAAQTGTYPVRLADVAVYSDLSPASVASAMRDAVWSVDKDQPIANVRTLEEVVAIGAQDRRFEAVLFGLFAALALVLAVVGIHGVVSYAVSQRTPEIGVRMALGADARTILVWILRESVALVVAGAVIGTGAALALAHLAAALLFQVKPTDAATYAAASGTLIAVALAASTLAARRATRVDPVTALRAE